MKSGDFHRLLRDALGPAFAAAGFAFVKGANARWSWNEAGRNVRVEFVPSRWGWSPPWGATFRVHIEESIDGASAKTTHVLEFLDVAGVRRFCELRNAVIDKGLGSLPGDVAGGIAHAVQAELRTLEKSDSPIPYTDTEFPWFDAADIGHWAGFFAPLVPGIVSRIAELAATDPKERRRALHECWKSSDARSDEEKTAHRVLVRAALARSNATLNTLGDVLTRPSA